MKYYDVMGDRQRWRSLNILIGARRIGKTFSILNYLADVSGLFIYMRNTQKQIDICTSAAGNPFKKFNSIKGRNIYFRRGKDISYIYEEKDGEAQLRGYAVALSTFFNLRGVSLSEVTDVFFDEFIEKRTLTFRQFETFIDFYDTVNDNRELEGAEPLRIFMASNAQRLYSPILVGLNLVTVIESMIQTGQRNYSTKKIWLSFPKSEVTKARKDIGLYSEIEGTNYAREALENEFANDSFAGVKKRNLNEFTGLAKIDDIYIYKHKSDGTLYACSVPCTGVPFYDTMVNRLLLLDGLYPQIAKLYANNKMFFSDYMVKIKLIDKIV